MGLRWPYLWLSGGRWPLCYSSGLSWPAHYSAGPPAATHSSAGPRVPFAAPEPCPVWVSAWSSAGSSSELECSAVRLATIPYRVSPGFSSIDAGMYVRAAALHRRSPPLPRRPRLYYDRSLCFLSISTLPSHIYSTILSFAKVTCNIHKNKKLLPIPLKLVPSLAKLPLPYFPPFHWEECLLTPKTSHPNFWHCAGRFPCSALSLLSFVAELFMVSRLPVFFMTLFHRVFM